MTGVLVDRALQARLGFSDHAIARFGQRAGLPFQDRMTLEPVLRDLLSQEGRMVSDRPAWARSRNTADAYVQVGDWLLLICRHDVRRPGQWTVVTVVNGPAGATWERAVARGLIGTPPPLRLRRPRRPRMRVVEAIRSVLDAESGRRGWAVGRVVAELRDRRERAKTDYRTRVAEYEVRRTEHSERRRAAREAHARRFG
jgi:hypothetical protein